MKLLLVGDVMLGRLVNDVLKTQSPVYPWGDTLSVFEEADFRLLNLECVISDRGRPWGATPKVFHFRTDAKNVAVLKVAEINAVSLANNHALDFEYDAMLECLKILDKAKIAHSGAGRNFAEAARAAICQIKNFKIGIISFTDNEPDWEAKEGKPGIFYVPIDLQEPLAKKLLQIVNAAKTKVDFLIVSAHWGPNWGYQPPAEHIPFAHALLKAGADVMFGHSGHVFRGIEIYQGKPIIYCAGDFIDDYAVDELERNDQSFIFGVEGIGKRTDKLELYPTVIRDFQARLAQGEEAQSIVAKMQKLCADFGTKTFWQKKEQYLEVKVG